MTQTTIRQYFAVQGSGLHDKDAQIIGPAIAELEAAERSTARDVREAARSRKSPLHPYVFDCNRQEAAEQYFLARASHLLRSIQVEVLVVREGADEPSPHRMRAWYPVATVEQTEGQEPAPRRYVSIERIREDANLASQVWRDGLRRLQLFRSQFRDYEDVFGPVFRATAEVEERLREKEVVAG